MRARCIAEVPSAEAASGLGRWYRAGKTRYPIDLGEEYTVLGVGFWDGVVWYEIAPNSRVLVSIPAELFQITDSRASRHWRVRLSNSGGFTLWPESFYHEFYHDHLSDGVEEALRDFLHLRALLEAEAQAPSV